MTLLCPTVAPSFTDRWQRIRHMERVKEVVGSYGRGIDCSGVLLIICASFITDRWLYARHIKRLNGDGYERGTDWWWVIFYFDPVTYRQMAVHSPLGETKGVMESNCYRREICCNIGLFLTSDLTNRQMAVHSPNGEAAQGERKTWN